MTSQAQRKVEHLQRLATAAADDAAAARAELATLEGELAQQQRPETLRTIAERDFPAYSARLVGLRRAAIPAAIDKVSEAEARAKAAAELHQRCADFMRRERDAVDAAPVPAQLKVGQSYRQAIEEIRADLRRLDDLRRETNNRPPARDDAVEAIERHVAFLAASGRPTVSISGNVDWPANGRGGFLAFTAWLAPQQVVERLVSEVPEEQPDAMTSAEREEELTAIADERLQLERLEEALISKAEAAGQRTGRRGDADPRAVLAVEPQPYAIEAAA
jgi:hypothetical protein